MKNLGITLLLHYSIYCHQSSRSTDSKTAPQHNTISTMLDSSSSVLECKASSSLLWTYWCSLWSNNFLFHVTTEFAPEGSMLSAEKCHVLSKVFFLTASQSCWWAASYSLQTCFLVFFVDSLQSWSIFSQQWVIVCVFFLIMAVTQLCHALYTYTDVYTVDLGTCDCFEMAPDLFKSITSSFRSMLSSSDFAIVVLVAESSGCIKQALLKWSHKSHQLLSIKIS